MVGSFAWTTTITTDNGLHRIYFLGFNYIVFLCSTFIVAILFCVLSHFSSAKIIILGNYIPVVPIIPLS